MKKIIIALIFSFLFSVPCFAGEKIDKEVLQQCIQQASDEAVQETDALYAQRLKDLLERDEIYKRQMLKIIEELRKERLEFK
jgi:hypothetical protein